MLPARNTAPPPCRFLCCSALSCGVEKKEDRGIDGPRPQWMDRGGDVEAHGELENGDQAG